MGISSRCSKRSYRKCDMSQMVEKGVIKKVGEGKNTRYVLYRNMPERILKRNLGTENS